MNKDTPNTQRDRTPLPSHLPRQVAERYRLLSLLGSGTSGAVVEAYDLVARREVALKILHETQNHSARHLQRFFREAEIVQDLQLPGVLSIFDSGSDANGVHYIAMERVHGPNLEEALQRSGHWTPSAVGRLAHDILQILAAIHNYNIVHRDLKPANILLTHDWDAQGQGTLWLADFGIAKAIGSDADYAPLTLVGETIGTPQFMAPEQIQSKPVEAQTDLYALGCILYCAACGCPPLDGASAFVVYMAHLERTPMPLSELLGFDYFPLELSNFIGHLLAKSPLDRPASADAALALLRPILPTLSDTRSDTPPPNPNELASSSSNPFLSSSSAIITRPKPEPSPAPLPPTPPAPTPPAPTPPPTQPAAILEPLPPHTSRRSILIAVVSLVSVLLLVLGGGVAFYIAQLQNDDTTQNNTVQSETQTTTQTTQNTTASAPPRTTNTSTTLQVSNTSEASNTPSEVSKTSDSSKGEGAVPKYQPTNTLNMAHFDAPVGAELWRNGAFVANIPTIAPIDTATSQWPVTFHLRRPRHEVATIHVRAEDFDVHHTAHFSASLKPLKPNAVSALTITTEPTGATIFLGRRPLGTSPWTLQVPVSDRPTLLRLQHAGFTTPVHVGLSSQPDTLHITLPSAH